MYDIPHFKARNFKEVVEFMHAHPFITLWGCDMNYHPVATHIPVLIEERNEKMILQAHVMRNQHHTRAFEHNQNVLAIFSGAHTYVSAGWYEKKHVASTWNYQAVHAKGILHWRNEDFLYRLLTRLTERFENNPDSAALVQKMDSNYIRNVMKAIIGFEIEITSVEHVFKLSQNRDEKSYENIIEHLQQRDENSQAIAQTMKKRKDQLF
jgi:transcriptional regulator